MNDSVINEMVLEFSVTKPSWLGHIFTLLHEAEWLENRHILDSLEFYKYGDRREGSKRSGQAGEQMCVKNTLRMLLDDILM